MWKITFSDLKSGQDLKNWAAHPHQEFLGEPPPPRGGPLCGVFCMWRSVHLVLAWENIRFSSLFSAGDVSRETELNREY